MVQVTGHELAAILSLAQERPAAATREALALPAFDEGDPVVGAVLSSLVLRGLAQEREGRIYPTGNLAPLVGLLVTAEAWLEALATAEGRSEGVLVVASPQGSAILEARPSGIWHAAPLAPGASPAGLGASFLASVFAGGRFGRPFGAALTLRDVGGVRTAGVRVDADGAWTFAAGPIDAVGDLVPTTPDPTFSLLEEAVR